VANVGDAKGAGCFLSVDKKGPCAQPPPALSPRAEQVWDLFSESMTAVVGMSVALAPNRSVAAMLAEACGLRADAEFWFLFGDLERAWVEHMNEKSEGDE
jgi:hypothetical protein